jgi:CRP-like cAMP-binding protein
MGNPEDLAAAQAVCLPASSGAQRHGNSTPVKRGVSLRNELANTPLLGDLDSASLHTLISRVRVVMLEAGQVLFRQGDAANSLYVIVEGAVVPIAEGERRRKLAVLERGEFFGEIGLMTKQPRNATIEAIVDTNLLAIDRRVLWELIAKQPSVAKGILRFLRARLIDRQIRTNLFFAAFAHAERGAVARQFRLLEVKGGTRVVEQGKPPDGLFVVLSGSLARVDSLHDKEIGEFGLGDVFGGLSLLEGQPANSDVIARGKCWLVVLGEGRFRRILAANPRLTRVVRRLARDGQPVDGRSSMPGL